MTNKEKSDAARPLYLISNNSHGRYLVRKTSAPSPALKKDFNQRFSELKDFVRNIFFIILFIFLTISISIYVIRDLSYSKVSIQTISVPEMYEKDGLTGQAISSKLLNYMEVILQSPKSLSSSSKDFIRQIQSENTGLSLNGPDYKASDLEIPGTGTSVDKILEMIRKLYGNESKKIYAQVYKLSSKTILSIKMSGSDPIDISFNVSNPDSSILEAAIHVTKFIQPYKLALYLERKKRPYDDVINYMLKNSDEKDDAFAFYLIGYNQVNEMKADLAINSLKKANSLNPKDPAFLRMLGIAYGLSKQTDSVNEKFDEANLLQPDDSQLYSDWGRALAYHEDSYQVSRDKYQVALKLDVNNIHAYNNLGVLYKNNAKDSSDKKLDSAVFVFKKCISIKPDFQDAYVNLANVLVAQKNFKEADLYFSRATQLTPQDAVVYYNWGSSLQARDFDKEAIEKFEQVLKLETPYISNTYYSMSFSHFKLGKFNDGEKDLRDAIAERPDYQEAKALLKIINDHRRNPEVMKKLIKTEVEKIANE